MEVNHTVFRRCLVAVAGHFLDELTQGDERMTGMTGNPEVARPPASWLKPTDIPSAINLGRVNFLKTQCTNGVLHTRKTLRFSRC